MTLFLIPSNKHPEEVDEYTGNLIRVMRCWTRDPNRRMTLEAIFERVHEIGTADAMENVINDLIRKSYLQPRIPKMSVPLYFPTRKRGFSWVISHQMFLESL